MFRTPRPLLLIDILVIGGVFAALIFAESRLARRYGHFPTLTALLVPFALLIAVDDFGNRDYASGTASVILAALAIGLIYAHVTKA